jgi:hypothetical protein
MKGFKLLVLALSMVSMNVMASIPSQQSVIDFFGAYAGKFSFIGQTYINTGTGNVGSVQQGIGSIVQISDDQGNILWTEGQNGMYLSYVFDDFKINTLSNIGGGKKYFEDLGGSVDFFASNVNVVKPTGNFLNNSQFIFDNSLKFLETDAVLNEGATLTGIKGPSTFSADAFLKVMGGFLAQYFNQNGFLNGFADMSFGIQGDTNNTAGYTSKGAVYAAGTIAPVPIPNMVWLYSIVAIGLLVNRRKTVLG